MGSVRGGTGTHSGRRLGRDLNASDTDDGTVRVVARSSWNDLMPEISYTQEELDREVRQKVGEYVQHQVVEQLQSRLDKGNHIRELMDSRLEKLEELVEDIRRSADSNARVANIVASVATKRKQWWESTIGRTTAIIVMMCTVAVTLKQLGVFR